MKTLMMIGLGLLALILAGCGDSKTIYITKPDTDPPAAPRGVTSTTGDGQVWVDWYPNGESDLAGYKVWKASEVDGLAGEGYDLIGTVGASATSFTVQNLPYATTYFYAVSAYDRAGNESLLQEEDVFDTPRPEGFATLNDFNLDPNTAGFSFSNNSPYGAIVRWDNASADIYFEFVPADNAWFINVTNLNTDIQDMGYTKSFDDVSYSPTAGWSKAGWVEAIEGHTYIVWTADDHYAKIRVRSINDPVNTEVVIDWGYQLDSDGLGQLELKPAVRPQHDPATYLRKSIGR